MTKKVTTATKKAGKAVAKKKTEKKATVKKTAKTATKKKTTAKKATAKTATKKAKTTKVKDIEVNKKPIITATEVEELTGEKAIENPNQAEIDALVKEKEELREEIKAMRENNEDPADISNMVIKIDEINCKIKELEYGK